MKKNAYGISEAAKIFSEGADILKGREIRNFLVEQAYIGSKNWLDNQKHKKPDNKQKYLRECRNYIGDIMSDIPDISILNTSITNTNILNKSARRFENYFIEKAIKELGVLTRPYILANYLKIDVEFILKALEKNLIPCFVYNHNYAIKTKYIIILLAEVEPYEKYKDTWF